MVEQSQILGSLSGMGTIIAGTQLLTIGDNNLNTAFSALIIGLNNGSEGTINQTGGLLRVNNGGTLIGYLSQLSSTVQDNGLQGSIRYRFI